MSRMSTAACAAITFMAFSTMSFAAEEAKPAAFKTISWTERRQWADAIKPSQYWQQRTAHANIDKTDGLASIMVDGKPMPSLTSYTGHAHDYCYYDKIPRTYHDALFADLTKGGIDYITLPVAMYVKNGVTDWKRARSVAKEFMKVNPDARFFLRLYFIVDRDWFSSTYPGNMTLFEDGTENHWSKAGVGKMRFSYASNIWENLSAKCLVKMADELAKEPYADRVFAGLITFGVSGEGNWWSEFDWTTHAIDYSPAMKDYFREFLRIKYKNDVKKLQAAWSDPETSFDKLEIPSMAERGVDEPSSCNESVYKIPGAFGHFRNPQALQTQAAIDFNMAMSDVQSERLAYLCEVLKRATAGKLIAGGLHSPPFAACLFQWAGPGGFDKIIKSPWIDFDCTPWTYEGRDLGEGLTFRGPADSMALRNKSLWIECDTRTSDVVKKERRYGAPLDIDGDRENLRRDFIRLITSVANGYWYEITFPWFTKQEQRDIIADIGRLSKKLTGLDRARNSEIAIIYDMDSIFYTSEFVDFTALCRQALQEFAYIGADYDMYTTDDIGNPAVDNHKLFIFPNAFALTDEKRAKIERSLKRDGKVLLWSYAPGLINPDAKTQLSVKNCQTLTGMDMGCTMEHISPLMTLADRSDAMTSALPGGYQFGAQPRPVMTGPGHAIPEKPFIPTPIKVFPQFYVDDAQAKALANYANTGKTGYAVKRMKDWTSIYAGTYLMPSSVLRAAAKEAKVHLYLDSDNVVYHNKSLLGIHTKTADRKTVRLPGKRDIYDIFENKLVGRQIDQFELDAPAGKTKLYFTGDEKDLQRVLNSKQ